MSEYKTARLRFERSIKHAEELSRLWNAIPSEVLLKLKPRVDSNGNGYLEAASVGEVPDELSLVLGEQLYQMRSTLDALVYQGAIYATGKNPPPDESKFEFPIMHDSIEWVKTAKRRLSSLPQQMQEAIKQVQPFTSEGLPPKEKMESLGRSLGILNDLARKDRHRQLHVMGSWPVDIDPQFELPEGVTVKDFTMMPASVLKTGMVIAKYRLSGFTSGMTVSIFPNLITHIGCDEPPAPCHPTDTFDNRLTEIVNAVGSILIAFENMF